MSSALAIAATTRVISAIIDNRLKENDVPALVGAPIVTTKAPDQLEVGNNEEAQLSLLLYRVTLNQGWRQVGLPSRNGSGAQIDRAPLALDLHYLLVAYGTGEYMQEMLLGYGMQALHETPLLYRDQIGNTFTPPPGGQLNDLDAALATAGIGEQIELIKLTQEPLSTEDLSKLWTSFGGKFRPSAAYEATVVLIESKTGPVQLGLPVQTRHITVIPMQRPTIDDVSPLHLPVDAAALTLTLTGVHLTGDGAAVVFDAVPAEPQTPQPDGGNRVTTALPPDLPAGINTFRVVKQVALGQGGPARGLLESNVAVFYFEPAITADPQADPPVNGLTKVTLNVDPVPAPTQRVQLLLNELDPALGRPPQSFTFDSPDIVAGAVHFQVSDVPAGDYLVRVRVDGAESALAPDYSKPKVTL